MRAAAAAEEFERAARLRDDIQALERALEKQAVVLPAAPTATSSPWPGTSSRRPSRCSTSAAAGSAGQRGWVVDKVEDVGDGELVEHFLSQVYGEDSVAGNGQAPARLAGTGGRDPGARPGAARATVPREVLVPVLPPGAGAVEEWLAARRGSRVHLRVPRRGDKKALLDTVARNAAESLALHKTKRASDLTTRSLALNEIQEALGLEVAPLRIECYDVSNLQGTHVVASMVVFEDGLARKSEYRRFSVRGTGGEGDVASVHEVITRRFRGTWRSVRQRASLTCSATRPHRASPSSASASSPTSPTWW
jgi:excinuclease ABC subunit C